MRTVAEIAEILRMAADCRLGDDAVIHDAAALQARRAA